MKTKNRIHKSYHVFADELDEYTATVKEAKDIWRKWKQEGQTNIRIYKLISTDEDEFVEEDYHSGIGQWPL